MSDLRDQLEQIADGSPAPTGARRDLEIQQAVTRGLATPARAGRTLWPWLVVGASVAAAAVIALVLRGQGDGGGTQVAVRDAGASDPVAVVDAGARDEVVVERGAAVPVGAIVDARELTVVRAGQTRVEAAAQTRFVREAADATRWRLEQGQLALRVAPGAALEVATPEARISVVGSQFVVGRYASETVIEVQVGEVLVTPTEGEPVTVHAGERWPAELVADAGAGSADTGSDTPPPAARDAGVARPARDAGVRAPIFDASIIRRAIRAGQVGDAREMIATSRAEYGTQKRALAELGILAAEADLAERKTKSAIGKYLDVVRDYAATPQAEQALFAAAQLAIDRPDAGYRAQALLEDYLATYPKGQFAKDAARLLDSLKK